MPGQSTGDLPGDRAMGMWVVPEQSAAIAGGNVVDVSAVLARSDGDDGVVAVAVRGDVEAVGVQVGRFGESVRQPDLGRVWIEGLRIDPAPEVAGLRWNQWLSIAVLVGVVAFLFTDRVRAASTPRRVALEDDDAVVGPQPSEVS